MADPASPRSEPKRNAEPESTHEDMGMSFEGALGMLRKAYMDSLAERDREIARLRAFELEAASKFASLRHESGGRDADIKKPPGHHDGSQGHPDMKHSPPHAHDGESQHAPKQYTLKSIQRSPTAILASLPSRSSTWNSFRSQFDHTNSNLTTLSFNFQEAFSVHRPISRQFKPWQQRLDSFLHSHVFEASMALLIAGNAVVIGVELETNISNGTHTAPVAFTYINSTLTVIFILELALRLAAGGLHIFCSDEKLWIWLDAFIVLSSSVELAIDITLTLSASNDQVGGDILGNTGTIRLMRFLRIIRLSRFLRITRIVRLLMSLRILIISITSTLKHLFWAMVLLFIIIYTYSLYFVQAVSDYLIELDIPHGGALDTKTQLLVQHWGSIPSAMLSLFACVADGLSWHETLHVLQYVREDLVFVFLSFIMFGVFAMLNVMTGVFCNSAIENAQNTEDFRMAALMETQAEMIAQVRNLFMEIDDDSSGLLTWKELQESWSNEQVKQLFAILGIEPSDLWLLFQLIDIDGSGTIDPEEMVAGCLRLKGAAKSFDVAAVRYEQKRSRKRFEKFATSTQRTMDTIVRRLHPVSIYPGTTIHDEL